MNSNKEKVGESSYWPELLGLFHWAELLYQCKLALRPSAKFDAVRKPGVSNEEYGPDRGRTLCGPTSGPSDE